MRLCIDSSVLIPAVRNSDPNASRILRQLGPDLELVIPRLVAQEVNCNLTVPGHVRQFYRLFYLNASSTITTTLLRPPSAHCEFSLAAE